MGLQTFLADSDIVAMTDAQAEAAALATYSLPIDTTPYTYSGLASQLLGYMAVGWLPNMTTVIVGNMRPLLSAITYNGDSVGQTLDGMLVSGGYDFGSSAHRAIISAWTPGAPPDAVTLIDAMLFVGAPTCPRWQAPQYGLSAAPTQSQITAARSTMSTESTSLAAAAWFANLCNESGGINQLIASGTATVAGIKAIVAAG